mgnify:FL=1
MRRPLIALIGGTVLLSSCASNDELEDRLDQRNANYMNVQERRGMRQDAREARDDAWYDRVMH